MTDDEILVEATKKWVGNRVVQFAGLSHLIGRTDIVQECFVDENQNVHCRATEPHPCGQDFWCPAALLRGCP